MKKVILALLLLLFSGQAFALTAITRGGDIACFKKEWLNIVFKLAYAGATESVQAYFKTYKCIILKKGLKVTVINGPGIFGAEAEFVYKGISAWTVREGLIYNNRNP